MLFNSTEYILLLAGTVALRWAAPRSWRVIVLLAASYLFYASWSSVYALLLLAVSMASFLAGLAIERFPGRGKLVMATAVAVFVLVLGVFKYSGFALSQLGLLADAFGLGVHLPAVSPLLPLGISFYTFTAIAYVVDVYRGEKAERQVGVHLVLIAFFPHLIAGPIVRKREVSEQLRDLGRPFDASQFSTGVLLILLGLFKKMVLADGLAPHADALFATPGAFSTAGAAVGILAYAGQILCDFSGYTDIGIGSAKLLGVDFPGNFNLPYLATSPADFWRRWHMTLSRWLRDYLWVWLGGTRPGVVRRYAAPILTMTIGGLWHGAGWTFVVWGLYHGLLLALHQAWARATRVRLQNVRSTLPYRALCMVATFTVVVLGWVLFRATSFGNAVEVFGRLLAQPGRGMTETTSALALLAVLAVGHLVSVRGSVMDRYERAPGQIKGVVWLALLAAIYWRAAAPAEFIYFQF